MNKVANFEQDLLAGQIQESEFHKLFPQLLRLDGRLADFQTSTTALVELKSDNYNPDKTPNFFFERYSYDKKPGGAHQALEKNVDYFCYWYPKTKDIYLFSTDSLVDYLDNRMDPLDLIEIRNTNHVTRGWLVKREDVAHLVLNHLEILK